MITVNIEIAEKEKHFSIGLGSVIIGFKTKRLIYAMFKLYKELKKIKPYTQFKPFAQ